MKILRSDNGTEFKNSKMEEFCKYKGIQQQFSASGTPQQNGVVERKNRTLIEAGRTLLEEAKLPTYFWDKAVNTACYSEYHSDKQTWCYSLLDAERKEAQSQTSSCIWM